MRCRFFPCIPNPNKSMPRSLSSASLRSSGSNISCVSKRGKAREEFADEIASPTVFKAFAALSLPSATEEVGAGVNNGDLTELGNRMEAMGGPILFLIIAAIELFKLAQIIYYLTREKTQDKQWEELKDGWFIDVAKPLLFIAGIIMFIIAGFCPPLGLLLFIGSGFLLLGAGLAPFRYLLTNKKEKEWEKVAIHALFFVAFALYLLPGMISGFAVLAPLLISLTMVYVLTTIVPSVIALWEGWKQKRDHRENFFTKERIMHIVNIVIAVAGIALTLAGMVLPPLAVAGLALLCASLLYSKYVMYKCANKKGKGALVEEQNVEQDSVDTSLLQNEDERNLPTDDESPNPGNEFGDEVQPPDYENALDFEQSSALSTKPP